MKPKTEQERKVLYNEAFRLLRRAEYLLDRMYYRELRREQMKNL